MSENVHRCPSCDLLDRMKALQEDSRPRLLGFRMSAEQWSQFADDIAALVARCERAEADAVHWKANHDKQVDSKRHTHDLLVQSRQHVESLLRSHEAADEEIDRLRQRLKQALR